MFKMIVAAAAFALALVNTGAALAVDYSVKEFLQEYNGLPEDMRPQFESHLELIVLGANASPMFRCFPNMENNGAELMIALQSLPAPHVWEVKNAVLKAARELCKSDGSIHEELRDMVTTMSDFSQWTPSERQEYIAMMAYGAEGAGVRTQCSISSLDKIMSGVSGSAPIHSALFVALSNQSCRVM